MHYLNYTLFLFGLCGLLSCGNKQNLNPQPRQLKDSLTEPLMTANTRISKKESEKINAYIKRKNWDMTETGTGLRYGIYASNNGIGIEHGDYVDLEYTLELLDGTLISKSKEGETEMVIVDKDAVESGLHEALKYLHKGDRAKVIIPSHLAFGLTGDQDKIPSFATLVYDLHIVEVSINENE